MKYIRISLILVMVVFLVPHQPPGISDTVGGWCGTVRAAEKKEELNFPRRNAIVKVVEVVRDSVVNISTERIIRASSPWDELFPFDDYFRKYKTKSIGSGVIVDEDGYILTNAHVVKRATRIKVTLSNKKEYEATLISMETESDLALIKINVSLGGKPDKKEKLSPITLGMSKDLMTGETAIALGNPFGLSSTVTVGVISATNRSIHISGREVFKDFLQTDAAINPGNSGGPLVNINGKLIGINVAIHASATGIGFAIPVDRVRSVLHDLASPAKLAEISTGFTLLDVPEKGVVVKAVAAEGAAKKAGVEKGDRLVSVEGDLVKDYLDLAKHVINKKPGDRLKVTVRRRDKEIELTMKLETTPETEGQKAAKKRLGLTVRSLPAYKAKKRGLGFRACLVIDAVEKDSPADRIGVKKGDVLLHMAIVEKSRNYWITYLEKDVRGYGDVKSFLDRTPGNQSVSLTVWRDGEELQGRLTAK